MSGEREEHVMKRIIDNLLLKERKGYQHWSRFVSQATNSRVPKECLHIFVGDLIADISANTNSDPTRLAKKIFGHTFGSRTEDNYANLYTNVMAAIKYWLSIYAMYLQNAEKLREKRTSPELIKICTRVGCTPEELPVTLERLTPTLSQQSMEEIKAFATGLKEIEKALAEFLESANETKQMCALMCGELVLIEESCIKPRKGIFRRGLWRLQVAAKIRPTLSDLQRVIGEVEEFFASEQNTARIMLMAQK